MYRSPFARDIFAEVDRLQRDMQQAFDLSPSIRGLTRRSFPALNVGGTPETIEIYAFAPGVEPSSLQINLERGVLTIDGERVSPLSKNDGAIHINERFDGKFRRVLSLPDDADPEAVDAKLTNGVLHVTVKRRTSAKPRRIEIA